MPAVTTERVHLSVAEARALSERAMRGIGYEPEEARILADHVIDAALCGYEYSGLAKLLNVAEHPRFKAGHRPMRALKETSVSVLFDGGNQSGMLAMYHATREVIERAQAHGVALVGVNNIWMSGRSAYYVEMVARAGLIGIHTVAAPPMVAPLGGAKAALGTNPIAFGFPMDGDPLVIDLGTSAFMGTDLQFRQRLGIPLGFAFCQLVFLPIHARGPRLHFGRALPMLRRRRRALDKRLHLARVELRRAQGLRAGPRHARVRRALWWDA